MALLERQATVGAPREALAQAEQVRLLGLAASDDFEHEREVGELPCVPRDRARADQRGRTRCGAGGSPPMPGARTRGDVDARGMTAIRAQVVREVDDELARVSTASVSVSADGAGCVVFLDGRRAGLTPATVGRVAEGAHEVAVQCPGAPPSRVHALRLRAGEETSLTIETRLDRALWSGDRGIGIVYDSEAVLTDLAAHHAGTIAEGVGAREVVLVAVAPSGTTVERLPAGPQRAAERLPSAASADDVAVAAARLLGLESSPPAAPPTWLRIRRPHGSRLMRQRSGTGSSPRRWWRPQRRWQSAGIRTIASDGACIGSTDLEGDCSDRVVVDARTWVALGGAALLVAGAVVVVVLQPFRVELAVDRGAARLTTRIRF